MRVIGIDPGLSATGYGIIEGNGPDRYTNISCGSIKTSSKQDIPSRLFHIYNGISQIIDTYLPDAAGIEGVFVGKDPRSHLYMGEARGVILLALKEKGIEIQEFSPLEVKKNITGYGGAQKTQVFYMISRLLGIDRPIDLHASDALAIAMCVVNQNRFLGK